LERFSQNEWETPREFYETLNQEFNFTLDVCASDQNKKCQRYFTKQIDGLKQDWSGERIWCNPPYDRLIYQWFKKAYEAAQSGSLVVCLIKASSFDSKNWHEYGMRASELRFVKDRLDFGLDGRFSRAIFPSAVLVFMPGCTGPPRVSSIDKNGKSILRIGG
jgi:site-specific DNA-methyltransferase (adenine-specific)